MEIDPQCANREIIFVVRMKVGARSLMDIPLIIRWKLDNKIFVLVIEVESAMLTIVNIGEKKDGVCLGRKRQSISSIRVFSLGLDHDY